MDGILTYVLIILLSVSYFNEFLTECYIFINLVETMVCFVIRFCLFLCIMTFSLPKHKRTTPVRRSSFMIGMYQTVRQNGIWRRVAADNACPVWCVSSLPFARSVSFLRNSSTNWNWYVAVTFCFLYGSFSINQFYQTRLVGAAYTRPMLQQQVQM